MNYQLRGLPYYSISEYYQSLWNEKVYKVPVVLADTCPNREGIRGMQTCIFCDEWGSAAHKENFSKDLAAQITPQIESFKKKYKAKSFLIYFQAYTNTFMKLSRLKAALEEAVQHPEVRGFVVGTRPDCLSKAVLDLWTEYSKKYFVAVELGVQTFNEEQLIFLRRGHTAKDSIDAIHKLAAIGTLNLGIHLIFGIPGETDQQIMETAHLINSLPIQNVKLHHLHVLKNTPLADLFSEHKFSPISLEKYAESVRIFLENLSPQIAVHRLAAYSSRWDELIAPAWTTDKLRTQQFLLDYLDRYKSVQGKKLQSLSADFEILRQKKISQFYGSESGLNRSEHNAEF